MKPVIILEGPDGAGKTTLTEKLQAEFGINVVRNHGPYAGETEIAHHYFESLLEALSDRRSLILDRSWLAEPIYGAVYRGGQNRITVAQRRMLERCALACRAVVVLCLPPFEACATAFEARRKMGGEYLDNLEQLRGVYAGYHNMDTELEVIYYDYTRDNVIALVNQIIARRPLRNGGPGAGHWSPRTGVLLIGDRAAGPMRCANDPLPPFVSFDRLGCSAWLTDQLEAAGVSERQLYWVNAFTTHGVPIDRGFIDQLKPNTVVALGANASNWCSNNAVDHLRVAHPQSAKRFSYGHEYELGSLLKLVLT